MYVVNWTVYDGYDGYYKYTEEKTVFDLPELVSLLSEICDEEDVEIRTE